MDQKVTPDVLCFIADCVVNYIEFKNNREIEFTVKDIWDFQYFNYNLKTLFSKPDSFEETASNEYDKFIQQPLKMLSYAKILLCEKRHITNYYIVNKYKILEYISLKEINAKNFIYFYLVKVLGDSDLIYYFNCFKENNTPVEFKVLKSIYTEFILKYTKINENKEVWRIFTKILNPFAEHNKIHGTELGRFSKQVIVHTDLLYNRENWRDKDKDKNMTRHVYSQQQSIRLNDVYKEYEVEKAKRIIKRIHKISELDDEYSNGEATQVHHIFMKSEYPEFAACLENLILLTPTQHLTKAHPCNNLKVVDKNYQLKCLEAKLQSIKKNINDRNAVYYIYSMENFIKLQKLV